MSLFRPARLLWTRLARVFRKPTQIARQPAASPEHAFAIPPPLAPAKEKYILFRCGDGAFDVYDGEEMVGDLYRQDGEGDRATVWIATLTHAQFDGFKTLKAAKDWLGQPPVRKYRREVPAKRSRRPNKKPTAPVGRQEARGNKTN